MTGRPWLLSDSNKCAHFAVCCACIFVISSDLSFYNALTGWSLERAGGRLIMQRDRKVCIEMKLSDGVEE